MLAPVLTPAAMGVRAARGPNQLVRATFCAGGRSVQGWLFVAAVVFVSFTPACEDKSRTLSPSTTSDSLLRLRRLLGIRFSWYFVHRLQKETPIVQGPNHRMLDWGQPRWRLVRNKLPADTMILLLSPTLWEQHKRSVLFGLLIVGGLGLLAIYLLLERKQLERARKAQDQLSGMLIRAQELERSRIAVEIHDDFSQRLAVLALNLGTAAEIIPESPQEASRQLRQLAAEAGKLGDDLHTLSHRLHSATLESLGLVQGVSAFCKEFSTQQGLRIDFTHEQVPPSVDSEIALCAFRTVQEALRNIKKHSGVTSARVCLNASNNSIHLIISDLGVGFDPKDLRLSQGLGVRSMAGRVSLLGGRFEIRSHLQTGTTVEAWLPLQPKSSPSSSA